MDYRTNITFGKLIGEGHFSVVHEGNDPVNGKVAIKILRQAPSESDSEWLKRKDGLVSEGQNLKAAEHANVVRVHNLMRASSDDSLHLICEFCDGGSLQKDYEEGPMPLHRVRSVINDVCLGLEAIHQRGMLHRDIKPANILRSGRTYKIGDFGLVTGEFAVGYASLAGYTDHLAPEVLKRRITSTKSDVWALGMTIYRLLHGKDFYEAFVKPMDIQGTIADGGFSTKLPWLPHVPAEWRRFIRKAMHDDSSQRFSSALMVSKAAASLPIDPKWECDFSSTLTHWELQKDGKTIRVTHTVISPRKHIWAAVRISAGAERKAGGSKKAVSGSAALAGLEDFFSR